jgi:extradiol dioxygenase family protein
MHDMPWIINFVIGPNLRFTGPPKRARNTFTAISPLFNAITFANATMYQHPV